MGPAQASFTPVSAYRVSELETPRSFLVQLPHCSDEERAPERGRDIPKHCMKIGAGTRSLASSHHIPEPLLGEDTETEFKAAHDPRPFSLIGDLWVWG